MLLAIWHKFVFEGLLSQHTVIISSADSFIMKTNKIRRSRRCVSQMHVHLVFVAKYRRKVFDGDAVQRLRLIFGNICRSLGAHLIEIDGEDDHVHLLVEYPPKLAVSVLVNSLKGVSSRLLRKDRPDIQSAFYYKDVCGRHLILRHHAAERLLVSLSNTSNSSKLQIKVI